jgi:hypothetical protein
LYPPLRTYINHINYHRFYRTHLKIIQTLTPSIYVAIFYGKLSFVGEVLCNLPGGDAGEEANDAHNGHSSLLRRQRR